MAKQYGLNSTVDFAAEKLMSFGKSFSRLSGQPLDKSEVWYNDLEALKAYAKTDAAYVGQKVVYIDTTNNTVTHYSVELDGTLKEIGVKPLGDNKSITVDGTGTVSIKNFGVEYYRLLTSEEEGYVEGEATYILQQVNDDYPWKSGLVPRVLNGAIAWYEPSDVTVEGLNSTVGSLQTAINGAEDDIDALEGRMDVAGEAIDTLKTVVGDAESGLVKAVADNKAEYDAYVAEHTYTDEQIDAKVAGAFHFKGDATLETDDEGAWTGNLVKDDSVITSPVEGDVYQVGEEEYVYDGAKWIKLGFTLDLTGYATKIELNNAKSELQSNIDGKVSQSDYNSKVEALEGADTALANKDAELESLIGSLRTDVNAINDAETGIAKTVKDYADSEIQKLNISQYATTEALGETNEAVAANAATIGEHKTLIDAVTATANNAATKATVEAIDGRLGTAESDISTLKSDVATNAGDISGIKAEQLTQNAAIEKNTGDISALTQTLGTATSDLSTLIGRVNSIEDTTNKNTSDLSALTTRVDALAGTVEGHAANIGKNASDIAANTSLINALDGRLTIAEGDIATLKSNVTTNAGDISTLKTVVGNADSGLVKTVNDLAGVVSTKADADKVYTKEETVTEINKAIAAIDHLKRSIVEELPAVENADVNTIYMILDSSVTGADKYNEWMVIDGAFACIGDTTVDLTNYVQKDDVTYTGALTDIANLKAVGAQANIIESIKVNGTALDITDKSVNIGIANDTVLGVVLSSTADNKIAVAADGTMEVNKLNVNKLVQTAGEQLILNGGNAKN